MANPFFVYLSTFAGKGSVLQSAFITFSFANSTGFEANIAIKILNPNTANISAGAEVYVMRSTDAGATYETQPDAPLGIAYSRPGAAATQIKDLVLRDPGMYLIAVLPGGGANTLSGTLWSVDFAATVQLVSAYA